MTQEKNAYLFDSTGKNQKYEIIRNYTVGVHNRNNTILKNSYNTTIKSCIY